MTLASIRDITNLDMIPCTKARVALHAGETAHFTVNEEGNIHVSVVTPRGQEINALLSLDADNDGSGVWRIPKIGTEVLVIFDEGDYENDAYLIGKVPAPGRSGNTPEDLGADQTIIQDTLVVVRDTSGGTAQALAYLRDLQAQVLYLRKQFDSVSGHHHPLANGPPVESVIATGTSSVPTPTGTSVLLGQ